MLGKGGGRERRRSALLCELSGPEVRALEGIIGEQAMNPNGRMKYLGTYLVGCFEDTSWNISWTSLELWVILGRLAEETRVQVWAFELFMR